jgi:hypothetical protein
LCYGTYSINHLTGNGENGEKKKVKHGFPSILSSSKKDEERDGRLGRLRRPGL